MKNSSARELVISGIGVNTAIGQGKPAFSNGLLEGRHSFARMRRPGRVGTADGEPVHYLGAEMPDLVMPAAFAQRVLRTASFPAKVAAVTVHEAWEDARLNSVAAERLGLIVGGSNLQQRELLQTYQNFGGRSQYIRPSYASTFLDSDISALCSELCPIRGFAHMLGGASASGQLAVIHAAQAVLGEQADVCIAVGALMDLSYLECQALRSAGAMGSDRYSDDPERACRPFDRSRDGFIYGEACAALVIESAQSARERGVQTYATLAGWGVASDGSRSTATNEEGELRAIAAALKHAGVSAAAIDYVNPHGTGSLLGDEVELRALRAAGLAHAHLNATKALTGHGLTAAGAVEIVATLLQMRASRLHPTRNLSQPIDPELNWVGPDSVPHAIAYGLSLSMGFGGINTAVCLRHPAVAKETRLRT